MGRPSFFKLLWSKVPRVATRHEEMQALTNSLDQQQQRSEELDRKSTEYLAVLDHRLKDNWFRCIPQCRWNEDEQK